MATKKTSTKKKSASKAKTKTTKAKASTKKKSTAAAKKSAPTPDDLSQAKTRAAVLRTEAEQAERELSSARTIADQEHRLPAVAAALDKLAKARAESMEASEQVAALKTALNSGNFHRTSALGKRPGKRPASAAAKRGEPKR